MILTGKPQLNRFVNRRLILDIIRQDGKISRAAVAKRTAIRPPTASAVIKQLIDEELVEEVGPGATSGGRAPRMLSLAKDKPRALGFELTESSILAGLCDIRGKICLQNQLSSTEVSPDRVVEQLYKMGTAMLQEAGTDCSQLEGVGVAIPGHFSVQSELVRWSSAFDWHDVPLKQLCEQRWGTTTDVVNDALAGGMAAQYFQQEQATKNLVFLFIRFDDKNHNEVGVGAGIIIDGQPYHGEFGAAGEIRTPVASPLVHAREMGAEAIGASIADFTDALKQGDPVAKKAIACLGKSVSSLVLQIVNLLEPGLLIIDSEEPVLRDELIEYLQHVLEKNKLAYEKGRTRLVASDLGEYGLTRGAIVPTLQRIFRIPQWS